MTKTNRFYYGKQWFTLPFRSNGYWVEDAAGKSVAEAYSKELATALADTLNRQEEFETLKRRVSELSWQVDDRQGGI